MPQIFFSNGARSVNQQFYSQLLGELIGDSGVSATTPTYTFEYAQVIHTRDAKSDCPGVRRLQLDKNSPSNNSSAPEMNDVCLTNPKIHLYANADRAALVYQKKLLEL